MVFKANEFAKLTGVEVFLVIKDKKKIKSFQTVNIGEYFADSLVGLGQPSVIDNSDENCSTDEELPTFKTASIEIQCELPIVKHFKLSTPSSFSNKENEKLKKKKTGKQN